METLSVMMIVCLFAGLSQCQAESEGNVNTTADATEDTSVDEDDYKFSGRGLEVVALPATNTKPSRPECEPLRELGVLQERLATAVTALEATNRKLEANERQLAALSSSVTELRRMTVERPRVAFSAALPVPGTLGPLNVLHPLVYRTVISNSGNAYSPVSGYFTAPVQGVYYFTFTSFDWGHPEKATGGSLYKNGQMVVSWYDFSGKTSSSSNTAILVLQVGDKVNVALWSDRRISDNSGNYASFSGFLIFPIESV